ncbi:hypothetical protein [Sphingomonas sp. URHD0057]|uniref:hypothetical protein n=1 Tax=Sphingomonas sp. URHD0057 TaxID=1380389 RepID=UPI0012DDF63F|nr:hypothetical protein [Sphingomonas sp. URHD0057]
MNKLMLASIIPLTSPEHRMSAMGGKQTLMQSKLIVVSVNRPPTFLTLARNIEQSKQITAHEKTYRVALRVPLDI